MDASDFAIEFSQVSYKAGERCILSALNLQVQAGELVVLLGRSGSGKTTALKLVNRLLAPCAGVVLVEGRSTLEWDSIRLRRRIGYAIQEIGLFPHYTVEQNIALLPTLEGWPLERIAAKVKELLELTGLSEKEFSQRYPDQLSGGQRQRVGLARALSLDPPILLMDEPFGALDPVTRAEIQLEFKRLSRKLQKTVLFVTHDTREALLLASRIAVLDGGRLQGLYTPTQFEQSGDAVVQPYLKTLQMPVAEREASQ
jgi:osmoprotectant transport system ATP-binding protein